MQFDDGEHVSHEVLRDIADLLRVRNVLGDRQGKLAFDCEFAESVRRQDRRARPDLGIE